MAAITVTTSGLPPYVAPVHHAPMTAVYRRRRVVALLAALAIILLIASVAVRTAAAAFGVGPASPPDRRPADRPTAHVVQPGESLWSVARTLQPEGDVRALVHELAELNGGAQLLVGQVLTLPAEL
jgi:hypothetical protein